MFQNKNSNKNNNNQEIENIPVHTMQQDLAEAKNPGVKKSGDQPTGTAALGKFVRPNSLSDKQKDSPFLNFNDRPEPEAIFPEQKKSAPATGREPKKSFFSSLFKSAGTATKVAGEIIAIKNSAPQMTEARHSTVQTVPEESRLADQRAQTQQATEQSISENKKITAQKIEAQRSEEQQVAENKKLEEERAQHAAEQRAAEENRLNAQRAEAERIAKQRAAEEKKVAEQRVQAQRAAEEKLAETKKLAEQRAVEQKRLSEQRAADEKKLAELKAEEKRIADQKVAEETRLASQKTAEEMQLAAQRAEAQHIAEQRARGEKELADLRAKVKRESESTRAKSKNDDAAANRQASLLYKSLAATLLILAIAGGGFYFWTIRQQAVVENTLPAEKIAEPTAEEVVEPTKPAFFTDKPNDLIVDQSSSEPAKNILRSYADKVATSGITAPVEFIVVDEKNNPLLFSDFAAKTGISFTQPLMANLEETFSLFIYNDSALTRIGLSIDSKDASKLYRLMATEEKSLAHGVEPILLSSNDYTLEVNTYGNSTYREAAIRYANITSTEDLSIDYAIISGKLLIGTTKMTLRSIIDYINIPVAASITTQPEGITPSPSTNSSL